MEGLSYHLKGSWATELALTRCRTHLVWLASVKLSSLFFLGLVKKKTYYGKGVLKKRKDARRENSLGPKSKLVEQHKIGPMRTIIRVTKTGWIFRNSVKTDGIGPVRISKPLNLLFTVSKFQKKIKVSKKYVKKLDQILRLLVKKFL
jgi:hypothetical protein